MLKFLKTVLGAGAALSVVAAAEAGVSEAEVRQMMSSKGLQFAGQEKAPDGSVHVLAGVDMAGVPYAFTMLDMELDGEYDVILFMSGVQTTSQPPLSVLNTFNENTMSKAVYTQNQAMLMLPMITMNGADQTNMGGTFDVLRVELAAYANALAAYRPGGGGNFLGVSAKQVDDPYELDAGMTRVEVKMRDAALAKELNRRGLSHLGEAGADDAQIDALTDAAFEASKAFFD
ncbi:hypothetical protein [Parvularcula lutaonensis]|uniref:Uncharacterized protein n=1 Tax=Parvularcula lutaonensis TaxID=491923 RepID=A0ABV7M9T0_9PROT|nr:hypothetical protein [Parvularcula lutaonensis]GGY47521.1 hypothetical protein GCM10007148_16140 [Parvularcula lutaonensis]